MDEKSQMLEPSKEEILASKSDLALPPIFIPNTTLKQTLKFENEELVIQKSGSKFDTSGNESQMNQTMLNDDDSHPEDDFEKSQMEELILKNKEIETVWMKTISNIKLTLNSSTYNILLDMIIIYVLIGDYFRIMIFRKNADLGFDIVTILSFLFLVIDFCLMLISQKKYLFSFYFYLDICMTLTIILDVTMISNKIFDNQSGTVRLATTSILNIIRIIRLIRIMKFVRTKSKVSETEEKQINESRKSEFADKKNKGFEGVKRLFAPKESKVTSQLKDMNVRRIILIVLLILIVVPLFDNSLFYQDRSVSIFDKSIFSTFNFLNADIDAINSNIKATQNSLRDSNLALVQFIIDKQFNFTDPDLAYLRKNEIQSYEGTIYVDSGIHAVKMIISNRSNLIIEALLDFCNTIFVGIIMLGSIWSLNNDMSTLVLTPLERMINKIRLIAFDPLLAIKPSKREDQDDSNTNETYIIESAINKITNLLMLGFGQAGCKIVSGFILDSKRDIDQLIPGEKTYAIFGFCDIKGFSDVTEILIEDIMLFVNTIAEIVHQNVDEFAGSTNKNIGEAFLMVWKLMDQGYKHTIDSDYRDYIENLDPTSREAKMEEISFEIRFNQQLAEFALLGFTKVLMEVNTNPKILKFANHPLIKTNLPGYEIKMSFGLHIGWAIEGAIGSSFKIDASYLSPNVNLASRVQYACKQFGVYLLFSGNLYDLFTNSMLVQNSRHIDTVNLKGSKQPIKLYTYDFNYKRFKKWKIDSNISPKMKNIRVDIKSDMQKKVLNLLKKNHSIMNLGNSVMNKSSLFKNNSVIEESLVEKKLSEFDFQHFMDFDNIEQQEFRKLAGFAVQTYLDGDWKTARALFSKCLKINPSDGPSETIFEYMNRLDFKVPENWKNCREMTEK